MLPFELYREVVEYNYTETEIPKPTIIMIEFAIYIYCIFRRRQLTHCFSSDLKKWSKNGEQLHCRVRMLVTSFKNNSSYLPKPPRPSLGVFDSSRSAIASTYQNQNTSTQ